MRLDRRELLKLSAASAAAVLAAPAYAQSKASVLRFVPSSNLVSLDPVFSTALVAVQHGYHSFDTLFGVNSKLEPKPQMAESYEVSADGLKWTIKLRDSLFFHDGEPVRSKDCIASLQRWSQKDTFGKLVRVAVGEYGVVDDRAFTISLKKPFPRLLDAIGKPHSSPAFIMPERLAATDPNTAITEVVGSGPYRFIASEFDAGNLVAYEKFDKYVPRQEPPEWTSGGKVAYFDRVEWRIIADQATAAAALQQGEVDWLEQLQPDLAPMFEGSSDVTVSVADPLGTIGVMRFNHLNSPFNNPKLRRFVAEVINQDDYLAAVAAQQKKEVCRAMFPCTIAGNTETGAGVIGVLANKPEALPAALKETGYNGEPVVILNPVDTADLSALSMVTADVLKRAGLNVDLQNMDWGTLLQRRASKEPTSKGGWSIFHSSWPAIAIATPVLNTTIRGEGSTGWPGWFESSEMEQKVADWLAAPTPEEAAKVAKQVDDLALEQMPTVPLGIYFPQTAYRSNLTGVLGGSVRYPWNVKRA